VRSRRTSALDVYEDATRPPVPVRAAGWLLFGAGLITLAGLYRAEIQQQLTFRVVFLASIGVLLLAAAGLAVATRRVRMVPRTPLPRWEIPVVVGLTIIGALMRTLLWNQFPPAEGQLLEEPQVAWNAVRSIRWGQIDAYFPIVNVIGEIGFRTIGPTMNGLRIPFVVLGILSVPIFYVAARLFLGTPLAAAFVTLLFATNSMLAGSSRIALETMHPIITLVVALAVVFWAGRRPTVGRCALAGVCNGLLLTEYDSYRLVPVLNFVYLAIRLGVSRDRREPEVTITWKRYVACLLAYGVFVVGVEMPRLLADPQHPLAQLTEAFQRHESYLDHHRAGMTSAQLAAEELEKLETNLTHLFLRGDSADILPPSMGHFDPYTGLLGVAALAFCLLAGRSSPVPLFLVVSVALIAVLSSVLVGNIARYRLMPVIPYYLLAIGVLAGAVERWAARARRSVVALLVVVGVGLSLLNVHRFFGVAINDREVQESFYDLSMVLSHEISELQKRDPGAQVVVLSDQSHLGVENDYAFWYDYEKVDVFDSPENARGREGYLLAHDRFIPTRQDLPGMQDCVRWTTRFDRNVILRCRLVRTAQ